MAENYTKVAIIEEYIIDANIVKGRVYCDDLPSIQAPVLCILEASEIQTITEEQLLQKMIDKSPPRSWYEDESNKEQPVQDWKSNIPSFMLNKANLPIDDSQPLQWYEERTTLAPVYQDGVWRVGTEVRSLANVIPLEALKSRFKAFLASYRYEVETRGVNLNGSLILTDRESQASVTGGWVKAKDNPNTTIDWKGANGWVLLDAATMIMIGDAVFNYVQGCFAREGQLSREIDACTTAEEVIAIDFTVGWPE